LSQYFQNVDIFSILIKQINNTCMIFIPSKGIWYGVLNPLELDPALDHGLHLCPSNHELSILALFSGFKLIDFPFQTVTCMFTLHLPLFGLGSSSKGHRSDLWLASNWIALFHWTLDFEPSCKAGRNTIIGQLWPVCWIINQFWRFQKGMFLLYCTRFSIFLPKKKCSLKKHFFRKSQHFYKQYKISVEAAKVLQ